MRFFLFTTLCLLSIGRQTQAELKNKIEVRSNFNGQNIYAIVPEGSEGEGIYSIGDSDDRPLLPGKVLGVGRKFNGVLAQLAIGRQTSRYESLAVLDGRLVLFSSNTKQGSDGTYRIFGSKDSPLLDALTGRTVELNAIQSVEDVQVRSLNLTKTQTGGLGEIVLVSVKQPNALGSGITFAFFVKYAGKSDGKIELAGKIYVIDYEFLTQEQLGKLELSQYGDHYLNGRVISRSHLLAIGHQGEFDSDYLAEWREDLLIFSRSLIGAKSKKKISFDLTTLPVFDIEQGSVVMSSFPIEIVPSTLFPIVQQFDPISGRSGVFLNNDETEAVVYHGASPDVPGVLTLDAKHKKYLISHVLESSQESQYDERHSSILVINNRFVFVLAQNGNSGRGTFKTADLGPIPEGGLLELSHAHRVDGENVFVILSWRNGKVAKTQVVALRELPTSLQPQTTFEALNRFESSELLELRTITIEATENKPSVVVFDNQTPECTKKLYATRVKDTRPFLDLTASAQKKIPSQYYIRALATQSIVPGRLGFMAFDSKGANEIRTGIYLFDNNAVSQPLVVGELLIKKGFRDTGVLDEKKIYLSSAGGDDFDDPRSSDGYSINVFALNPNVGKDSPNKFQLGVFVDTVGSSATPKLTMLEIPEDFKRLQGVKIISGKRNQATTFTVLLFFQEEKTRDSGSKLGQGGVYAASFTASKAFDSVPAKVVLPPVGTPGWLARGTVGPSELVHRIISNASGELFWIEALDRTKESRNFAVRRVTQPADSLYPNRSAAERIALRFDDGLQAEDTAKVNGLYSRWSVFGRFDIEKSVTGLEQYTDHILTLQKAEKTIPDYELFPGLDGYLEDLASPAGKNLSRTILLVEPSLKQTLYMVMCAKLALNESGHWSLKSRESINSKIHLFSSAATENELLRELAMMSNPGAGKRAVLLGNLKEVVEAETPFDENEARSDLGKIKTWKEDPTKTEEETSEEEAAEEETVEEEAKNEEQPVESLAEQKARALKSVHEGTKTSALLLPKRDRGRMSPLFYLGTDGVFSSLGQLQKATKNTRGRIPTVLIATPAEWREIQAKMSDEFAAGLGQQFRVESRFLTSSMTVWPPGNSRASKEVIAAKAQPIIPDEMSVFADFKKKLDAIASGSVPPSREILIVPDKLKPLLMRLMLGLWVTESKVLKGPWNVTNPDLALYRLSAAAPDGTPISQELVADNFSAMHGVLTSGRRPVLVGDLESVLRAGVPPAENPKSAILLVDKAAGSVERGVGLTEVGPNGKAESVRFPHMLWLVAHEAEKLPKGQANFHQPSQIPTLLIGTESEWKRITGQDTLFEQRFGLLEDFLVTSLTAPNTEQKAALLNNLFETPEIARLGYQFKVPEANDQGHARDQIIALLINRVDEIARQLKHEPTHSFIRAYGSLSRALVEDVKLRTHREIDRNYLERLLAQVFPLPLSFSVLAPDDPLQRLKDPLKAVLDLQARGYEGPFELKERFVRGVVSQTRPTGQGRPVPASFILIGGTGSGKTFLWDTTIGLMGLKSYDFDMPQTDEPIAVKIKVDQIVETPDPANPGWLPIDTLLTNLSHLLSLPKGYRAAILWDDLHKAKTPAILNKILGWIQMVFDAPNGIIRVRRAGGELREVPVRNLILGVTLNLQSDLDIRKRFVDKNGPGDIMQEIIAAISRDGVTVEESLPARFGEIINVDSFPRDAKAPALVRRIREYAQGDFSANSRLVLVHPGALEGVVDQFATEHARKFLDSAANALISVPGELKAAPIYLVLPNESIQRIVPAHNKGPQFSSTNEIEGFVQRSRIVKPVIAGDVRSQAALAAFFANSFRILMMEQMLLGAQQSARMSGNFEARDAFLAPFILGAITHVEDSAEMRVADLEISARKFGLEGNAAAHELEDLMEESGKSYNLLPELQGRDFRVGSLSLDQFLGKPTTVSSDRGRLDVMDSLMEKLEGYLLNAQAQWFGTEALSPLPDARAWLKSLDTATSKAPNFRPLQEGLLESYFHFVREMYDQSLIEVITKDGTKRSPNDFDVARLFFIALDRVVARLPWAEAVRFTVAGLTLASSDMTVGQLSGVHRFLFENDVGPFVPRTTDYLYQRVRFTETYRRVPSDVVSKLAASFRRDCKDFFMPQTEGGAP